MGQKHYSQAVRDEAVLFYERGHTFSETKNKYGISESTFYEWKKKFDQAHPIPKSTGHDLSAARKAQRHLEKLSLELEVLRQCPCGIHASIDEKMAAINILGDKYSVHVLCDASSYYHRSLLLHSLTAR